MSRFTPCELKAMASECDMGFSQRIIFLVWGEWQGDAARHCSTEQTNKAQNDRRVVPDVGLGVAAGNTPGTTLSSNGYKVIIC